jgi:hypothetical protein
MPVDVGESSVAPLTSFGRFNGSEDRAQSPMCAETECPSLHRQRMDAEVDRATAWQYPRTRWMRRRIASCELAIGVRETERDLFASIAHCTEDIHASRILVLFNGGTRTWPGL